MLEKILKYGFSHKNQWYSIDICLNIPFNESIEELVYILIAKNNIPICMKKDLINYISRYVSNVNALYYDNIVDNLVLEGKNVPNTVEDITKELEKLLRDETAEYGERKSVSDEELFAAAYHKLVHSPMSETMLQLEHTYAQLIKKVTCDKEMKISEISDRQTDQMNNAIDRLGQDMTEAKINEIAANHFDEQSLYRTKLTSELETLKEAQRREYREWVMQIVAQNQANSSLPTPKNSPLTPTRSAFPETFASQKDVNHPSILEESFTIHLGSQLKQMHNIRILSVNVMDLCEINDNRSEINPQRLLTSLALYCNDLCGLVLMTDSVIGSRMNKDFRDICQSSTEFHFTHIDDQLETISSKLQKYVTSEHVRKSSKHLLPGDFYITKHSNLSQVHVVFHISCDDSLRSSDIDSRHPVVLGLRNVLKTACTIDVTTLTIPLLLQYEMLEEMTVAWCVKRAELVFKCVKGFMIEMASWGGSDLKNLQFLLPQGISSEVFQSLTSMLPSIFKVSNPLVLKTLSKKK